MTKHFSHKYRAYIRSPLWRFWRAIAFTLFLGRDALIPLLKAQEGDHLHYKMMGWDLPVISVLPLHHSTHLFVGWLRTWLPRWLVGWGMRAIALCWLYLYWYLVIQLIKRF